ncbi:phosphoenolpyruvate--protein phosphotransferase [soil metagenome]
MADKKADRRIRRLVGLGVSHGLGKGNVVFLPTGSNPQFRSQLTDKDVEVEIRRFRSAVDKAKHELLELSESPTEGKEHPVSEIFSVHLLILESPFVETTESVIREQKVNAEWALKSVLGEYSSKQAALADVHFRDKYLDIEDVASRITRAMKGSRPSLTLDPNAVVVAHEMRPSAVIELAKYHPAGLITEIGGWTSHMSIVAREFRLPMVTGIKNVGKFLKTGDLVVVDGDSGEVLLDPDGPNAPRNPTQSYVEPANEFRNISNVTTTDGVEIVIRTNAEDPSIYRTAEALGARGVGLYRSELLISDRGVLPDEEQQVAAYSEMARAVGEFGVAIRTFDVMPEQDTDDGVRSERNPALGLRAIRAGLSEPTLFKAQIRSILRASNVGKVDIVLPMISNIDEILQSRSVISSVRRELIDKGTHVKEPRIGIMVEVPSTVLAVSQMARHVDFLCLGTNDLVQYLLAVDRDNDMVAGWYQTLNPAVLSAIKIVLEAAAYAGISTTVCGEMAGSPFYVPVLIGLGARDLSINANSIRPVIKLISGISAGDAAALVNSLKSCETAGETELKLREYYQENWDSLFPPGLVSSKHR